MATLTQLIEHYCPDGVEYVDLGNVVAIRNGSDWKTQEPGDVAVYGSGGKMEPTVKVPASVEPSVLLPRKGSLDVQFVSDPFWNIDTAFRTETDPSRLSMKYFYYLMKGVNLAEISTSATRPSLTQTALKKLVLPLPPREVQDAIVERLDAFAALIENLDSEVALREKRFEYFREQLLSFDELDGVEYVKLGDLGRMLMCKRIFKKETAEHGDVPFFKIGTFGKEPDAFISRALFDEYRDKFSYPRKGELLISASGSIGRIVEFEGKDAYYQDSNIVWLRHDESRLLNRYLKYCYAEVEWYTEGGTIKRLYGKNLHNTVIPLPSLEVQQDIADKLDTMQALIDNLKQERDLRKAQFEYYREKLLTFNS